MLQNVAKGWHIVTLLLLVLSVYLGGNSVSFTALSFIALSSERKHLGKKFLWFQVFTVLNLQTECFPQKCYRTLPISLFSGMWYYGLWSKSTLLRNVLWKICLMCWNFFTLLHDVTSRKVVIPIVSAVRTSCLEASLPDCSMSRFRHSHCCTNLMSRSQSTRLLIVTF
jgi:hypothetical protein